MAIFSLTRKADYGLQMLAALASRGKDGSVSVKRLSEEKGLPRAFLAQIGQNLVRAGIVGSKEGRNGGYFLVDEPKNIKVKSALEAIEGEVALTWCIAQVGSCPIEDRCEQKGFMHGLTKNVADLLNRYTLADLV